MTRKFKTGEQVMLINNDDINAMVGATATVVGYHGKWLRVIWNKDNKRHKLMQDGGYVADHFKLYNPDKKWDLEENYE